MSKSGNILDTIAASTRKRVERLMAKEPPDALVLRSEAAPRPRAFLDAFAANPLARVIAEVKLASPSEGDILPGADPVAVAGEYLANGAAALSVLTEPEFFKGDIRYLSAIRKAHPSARLLMKDFIVHEYQLHLGRAEGADAALILLAMLPEEESRHLFHAAQRIGLTPLVEVHDEFELDVALELKAPLIGVNNRNLKTMQVSLDASERLVKLIPHEVTLISESGIRTREDIARLTALGYDGFLVGTQLMRTGRPGNALAQLLGSGP